MQDYGPALLDIVMVDGRWGQVVLSGQTIRYLDDYSYEDIDWKGYQRVREIGLAVRYAIRHGEVFTDDEIENIYWGPEQEECPYLKLMVKVFGEFEKKT